MCLGGPAFAESGDNFSAITVKGSASATQPDKKVVKKAEQKSGKQVQKTAKVDKKTTTTAKKPVSAKKKDVVEVAAVSTPVELRSDTQERGLFSALFGGPVQMLPETQRRDAELRAREQQKGKKFKVKADFVPQVVDFQSSYSRGTIVVNTAEK